MILQEALYSQGKTLLIENKAVTPGEESLKHQLDVRGTQWVLATC